MKYYFDGYNFMILPTVKSIPVKIIYEGQPMTDEQKQEGIRRKFETLVDSANVGMFTLS